LIRLPFYVIKRLRMLASRAFTEFHMPCSCRQKVNFSKALFEGIMMVAASQEY